MRRQVAVELLGVERSAGLGELVESPFRGKAESEPHVAELQVEVDDGDLVAALGEADSEVAGRQGLAGPALRAEDADHRREGDSRRRARALPAGHGLAEGEEDVLLRLGQRQEVVRSGLENPLHEPVRGSVADDDHRPLWALLDRAVDEEERAIGGVGARHHKQVRRCLLERRPAVLQAVDDADDLDLRIDREDRLERIHVDPLVDRDERSGRVGHCPPPNDLAAATGSTPKSTVSSVTMSGGVGLAPVRGRRTIQTLPFSEEKASLAACSWLTRTVTFDVCCAPAPKPAFDSLRRVEHEDVFDEQLEDRPFDGVGVDGAVGPQPAHVERAVDVHAVACANVADHPVRRVERHRDSALLTGDLVRQGVRRRRAEVADGQLLARVDVGRGDEPAQGVGVRDRAFLEIVLRRRGGLEEALGADHVAGRSLLDEVLRHQHRHGRRGVVHGRAVPVEVRDEHSGGEHRPDDGDRHRPAAGGQQSVRELHGLPSYSVRTAMQLPNASKSQSSPLPPPLLRT